ncbi:hypothetical protein FHW88_002767 [Mucilaginibacter sp. SG538B]|uniref:hypothetical protein n=1 Tax=Mucilaginibacter sp. SG538B TaxID=2587021 RepID=UPI00159DDBBA|nr:hypothetical protein [Mucilaginibacter sp. SG538B]NVM64478.1 hypothetical protein [Mucilaginibacter sp. SG538B]
MNGVLTFKGTIPLGNPDSARSSFLSVTARGALVDGNFATVFKDTKLNTTAGISVEWNFRLWDNQKVTDGQQASDAVQQMTYNNILRNTTIQHYSDEFKAIDGKVAGLRQQIQVSQQQKALKEALAASALKKLSDTSVTAADKDKAATEYQTLQTDIPKIDKSTIKMNNQIDSMSVLKANVDAVWLYRNQQVQLTNDKNDKIQAALTLMDYTFNWFTLIAGAGKKDYYIFDKSLPFGQQLQNPNLPTFQLGLAFNTYKQNDLKGRAWQLSIGALRSKDNNIDLLQTEEISQEASFKNAAGDTTRKAAKKFNAYTDPGKIKSYQQWSVYANYYWLFNGGNTAIHFFPTLYKPDNQTGYMDTGVGVLFSFKDSKNLTAKLNLEAYLIVGDAFNNLGKSPHFGDSNEFGVRATVPFNRLFK